MFGDHLGLVHFQVKDGLLLPLMITREYVRRIFLKEKYEIEQVFKNFVQWFKHSFNIQVFRSDNGKEYFNTILGKYFFENDIVHQNSCNDTPQQNGVVARKNKHLLEMAQSLSTKVPKNLWGEAILTTTYLINRMPTRVLKFQTPSHVKNSFPTSWVSTNLPLKIFGCITFVHVHNHNYTKLDPRTKKCVYVGYSPTQKGYKCFDPISKKKNVCFHGCELFLKQNHIFVTLIFRGRIQVKVWIL